jgi:hypothetical protein
MDKNNIFFGATLSYANTISYYYSQDDFSRFVIQVMIENGTKADDDYNIVLWAIKKDGKVMNGHSPIQVPSNGYKLPGRKKVYFANVPFSKEELAHIYQGEPFDIELKPVYYQDTNYVAFEVLKAGELTLAALKTLNPSPPA